MPRLPNGLYDLLITQGIERELNGLGSDRRYDAPSLEPADAHVILGRYIAAIVREALRGVPEAERPARQAAVCNELVRSIGASLPQEIGSEDLVAQPPRRLAAVYAFDPLRDMRAPAPTIPLSQSDLLVNARDEPRIGNVVEREIESADRTVPLSAAPDLARDVAPSLAGKVVLDTCTFSFESSGRPWPIPTRSSKLERALASWQRGREEATKFSLLLRHERRC